MHAGGRGVYRLFLVVLVIPSRSWFVSVFDHIVFSSVLLRWGLMGFHALPRELGRIDGGLYRLVAL